MSNKKYFSRYVTNIPFEKHIFDEVNELLPKGITISDEINAFLKDRLKELKEQKKDVAPNEPKGAIIYNNNKANKLLLIENKKQVTLDIFGNETEIIKYMIDLKEKHDVPTIRKLTRNGQLLNKLGVTYFKENRN